MLGCTKNKNKIEFSNTEVYDVRFIEDTIEANKEQLDSLFLIIDSLQWQHKEKDEDYSYHLKLFTTRAISKDKNELMIYPVGEEANLHYFIDIPTGNIVMGYFNLSSTWNNLYSTLSKEQIDEIITILDLSELIIK